MKIIVGLGNPGKKYEKTRHNAGFMVVEVLAKKLLISNYKFLNNKKFNAEMCEISKDILLVKPQTYMNDSGIAVNILLKYKNINDLNNLIVIHDDMDLELGRIKIQLGGGSGGHHGIESIVAHIGSADFIRIRFGVGRMLIENGGGNEDIGFLLSRFNDTETKIVNDEINKCIESIEYILENGIEKAMNEFNGASHSVTSVT